MNLHCAVLLSLMAAATTATYSIDCIPARLEMDFEIVVMDVNGSNIGHGRFHQDLQEKNITVVNITSVRDDKPLTMLFLSDYKANRSYIFNTASGDCSLADDSSDHSFDFIGSIYIGAEADKVDALVFECKKPDETVSMIITKKLCIPLRVTSRSAGKTELMNFFNATIGIKDADVLSIPDKCKTL